MACDPSDGNARIGLWHEALRRNERGVEDESLGALVTTSFIPSAVLAFNRWVLSSLPSGAILITQGDWDTFPALALQVAEGLRPDVVVANVQLLKHPWYVRRLATRYQLPMPVGDTMALAARVIETWIRSTGEEDQRPLTFAATVDTGIANGISLRDAGAYRLAVSNAGRAEPDTAAMRASLEDLRGSDFTGPHADETDRSAVRWAVDPQLALYVLRTAVRYAGILVNDGRTDEASRVLNWATTFAKDARMTDSQTASLREIREAVSGR